VFATLHRVSPCAGPVLALLILLTGAAGLPAQEAAPRGEVERVEASLVRYHQVEGRPVETWTLAERMHEHGVPGASVAVILDGEIAWAKGYGVKDVETGEPVEPTTVFQAASISKPVAVTGVLRLVEEGALELDVPVDRYLRSWTLPTYDWDEPVTLRRLASHTAGTTVHGFPGYVRSGPRPGTAGVLRGEGNTEAVVVDVEPGSRFRYSGGGTTVLQLVVEDVTGRPFEDHMADAVLAPAGMEHSTFAQPLPEDRWTDAASGHRSDGTRVEEDWHVYPEKAAAGLWTTPSDLARFAIAIQRSLRGGSGGLLSESTAEAMLTPVRDGYGLGFGIGPEPGRFGHGGANEGFRATLAAFRDGRGVVVMTNSDRGGALAQEILLAVGRVYGWDELQPRTLTPVALPEPRRSALPGVYADEGRGLRIVLEPTDDDLFAVTSEQIPATTLVPVSPTELVDLVDGVRLTVEWEGDRVVALRTQGVELVPVGR
jgi:CubicO group peptidase (beta-lactamase class C family)